MKNLSLDEVLQQFNDSCGKVDRSQDQGQAKASPIRTSIEQAKEVLDSDTELGHKAQGFLAELVADPLFHITMWKYLLLYDIDPEALANKVACAIVQILIDEENETVE